MLWQCCITLVPFFLFLFVCLFVCLLFVVCFSTDKTRSFADHRSIRSLSERCKRRTLRRPGNEDNPRSVVHGRSRSVMKRHLAEQKAGCYAKSPLCRSELRYRPSTHTHMQQTVSTNKHLSSPTPSSIKITQRQSFLDKPTQSMLSYIHARSRIVLETESPTAFQNNYCNVVH